MSKIDTSDIYQVGTYWGVSYKGKCFEYFTSKAGAEEYLEVLRNGKDEIISRGIDKEEVRAVPKVSGVLQGSGSGGSYQPRKRTYPELL